MGWSKSILGLGIRAWLVSVFFLSSAVGQPGIVRPLVRCNANFTAVTAVPSLESIPHVGARAAAEKIYSQKDSVEDVSSRPPGRFDADAKIISDPLESLAARLMVIRNAKHTLDLTIYIFSPDAAGRLILNEVREAVKRGVAVRILADSVGSLSPYHTALRSLLATSGGPSVNEDGSFNGLTGSARVVLFNSLSKSFLATASSSLKGMANAFLPEGRKFDIPDNTSWINHRLHDKLFLADALYGDRATALLGGRNIANHYFGLRDNTPPKHDIDVLLRPGAGGTGMGALFEAHFNRLFYHSGNYELERSAVREWLGGSVGAEMGRQKEVARLLDADRDLGKQLRKMEDENYLHEGFEPIHARLLTELANLKRQDALTNPDPATNPKNPVQGDSILRWGTHMAKRANHTIDIVTPYLYLTLEEIRWLQNWVDQDPKRKVRIVTNGILSMDHAIVRAMVDGQIVPALFQSGWDNSKGQIEFYELGKLDSELTGGSVDYGSLHTKLMVVDSKKALVTSSNGDLRSRWLQSELGVQFTGAKSVAEVQANIDGLVQKSTMWGSPEWKEIQAHPSLWYRRTQLLLYQRLLKTFNLAPLL